MILNLKKILDDRNISVNQLHKMTGISRTTLDPLAKSNTVPQKTRIETLERIAKELNINLNELINFENDYKFDVKILERYSHIYESYERKMQDRLIIECKFNSTRYLFYAVVRYDLGKYFDKKYSKEFQALDDILDELKDGKDEDFNKAKEKFIDSKFGEKSNYIAQKAYEYSPPRLVFYPNDIWITNFYSHMEEAYRIPKKYETDSASYSMFSNLLLHDQFIELTANVIAEYYNLNNAKFIQHNSPFSKAFDENNISRTLDVDYLVMSFDCENEKYKKSVEYTYKKSK